MQVAEFVPEVAATQRGGVCAFQVSVSADRFEHRQVARARFM